MEETVEELLQQLRKRGFQDDAELTKTVPMQHEKLTVAIPRESLTDTALENLQKSFSGKTPQSPQRIPAHLFFADHYTCVVGFVPAAFQ